MIQLDRHTTHIIPEEHFSWEDTALLKNGRTKGAGRTKNTVSVLKIITKTAICQSDWNH